MIFVDADFFIGFYNVNDALHERCLRLSRTIEDSLITSWDVVDETATKLCYVKDKKVSEAFLDRLAKEHFPIVYPDHALFHQAREIFAAQTTKHVSFTDCVNIAIARQKHVTHILSFDGVYEKNGLTLVKES